ncbi:MAG: hypothetical protein ABEK03_09025 [Candidatus Bipolaricaulia bacterium]
MGLKVHEGTAQETSIKYNAEGGAATLESLTACFLFPIWSP